MQFVEPLRQVLDLQVRVTSQVSEDDFARQSRCAGWTVRTVLNHSVAITQKFTAFAAGATDAPRTPSGNVLGDDPWSAVRAASNDSALAWGGTDLTRPCVLPFARVDGHLAAGINLVDALAHTWDIATPLGIPMDLADDVWQAALDAAEGAFAINRDTHQFDRPVALPAEAPLPARFLAFLGRRPE